MLLLQELKPDNNTRIEQYGTQIYDQFSVENNDETLKVTGTLVTTIVLRGGTSSMSQEFLKDTRIFDITDSKGNVTSRMLVSCEMSMV